MKPIRLLLTILTMAASLTAQEPRTERGTLIHVEGHSAEVALAGIPEGVSGIVVHSYDATHKAIVASVFVTGSKGNFTKLKLVPYRGLRQPNLPTIKTAPQNGDLVILGYLYDRVLPVVPNEKSFVLAKRSFPKLRLIHPDLMAAELAKDKSPIPTKEHFQRMCEKFSLGLVLLMFHDGTDFVDCISWKKVGHADVASVDPKHFKQPFYNRFEEIPSPFYDWSEHKIENFDAFYKSLEKRK